MSAKNYLDCAICDDAQLFERKISAVVVCVDYADFLAQTLPFNRNHFDRLVVVTSEADKETQRLCEYWHVECLVSNCFFDGGDVFNKAKGINIGLRKLDTAGWVVHLDADIYLPPRTRQILNLLELDGATLYGIDRQNCIGFDDWQKYLANPHRIYGRDGLLRLSQFEIGARLLNLDRDGYLPLGFFQMWNPRFSGIEEYPECHGEADRTDVLFSSSFPRSNRQLIPELIGIHLESELCPMGANWSGRKTIRFGDGSLIFGRDWEF